jgi:hypothetical protein
MGKLISKELIMQFNQAAEQAWSRLAVRGQSPDLPYDLLYMVGSKPSPMHRVGLRDKPC